MSVETKQITKSIKGNKDEQRGAMLYWPLKNLCVSDEDGLKEHINTRHHARLLL